MVGAAADAYEARDMIRDLKPDVITLDVEMPKMNGLEFLDRLMRARPTPVVMISSFTERGSEVTFRALELGAVEFVTKPKLNEETPDDYGRAHRGQDPGGGEGAAAPAAAGARR